MLRFSNLEQNNFRIYRHRWLSITYYITMGIACSMVGILVLHFFEHDNFIIIFAGLFLVVGISFILNIPLYRRILEKGGDTLFQANWDGIYIYDVFNANKQYYKWNDITKIILANKAISKGGSEVGRDLGGVSSPSGLLKVKTRQNNLMIIFLNNKKEWSIVGTRKKGIDYISISPKGTYYSYSKFYSSDRCLTQQALQQFSNGKVPVENVKTLMFDYWEKTEEYVP